jgi:hypothetical protein
MNTIDPKEEFAAWWAAYLSLFSAFALEGTKSDSEMERLASEKADLVMRMWRTRMSKILNPDGDGSIAEKIYLESKLAEERRKANGELKDHVPESNPQ